jgi:phosphatidate cytidylyltransferase
MAITTLGIIWIGVMGAFAAAIVALSNVPTIIADGSISTHIGTDTLCLLAIGVVANDVGALFVGSAVGRTPLRAWISPNKSVEGFIGGSLASVGAMVLVGVTDRSSTWNSTGDLILLGLVIAIAAPIGDLTESMFKRNLDVKDFGSIVKGHGGILDRFDGFLFTLPAVYFLLVYLQPWLTK